MIKITDKDSIKLSKSQIEILEVIQEGEILRIDNMNTPWLRDRVISSQTRYFFTENKLVIRKDKRKAITTKGNGFIISKKGIDVLKYNKEKISITQQSAKITIKRKYRTKPNKICPTCKCNLPSSMFFDANGKRNPRGRYCIDCRKNKPHESKEKHFDDILSAEIDFCEKYKIIYGDEWKFKAQPSVFFLILFLEIGSCPYCGESFEEDKKSKDYFKIKEKYQIDHMNPLVLGGEDTLSNVVCVCKKCNLQKHDASFEHWLEKLPKKYKSAAQKIYIEKHRYAPNEFTPKEPICRSSGMWFELCFDIEELKEMKKNGGLYFQSLSILATK